MSVPVLPGESFQDLDGMGARGVNRMMSLLKELEARGDGASKKNLLQEVSGVYGHRRTMEQALDRWLEQGIVKEIKGKDNQQVIVLAPNGAGEKNKW